VAGRLDRIRRVDVNVFQPLNAGGGEAVLKHMLFITSGRVAAWRQGAQVMLPACSEARIVEFPRYGRIKVWNMGHTEPSPSPTSSPAWRSVTSSWALGVAPACRVAARHGLFGGDRRIDLWLVSWRPWSA